jgi:hypothetical protein
MCSNIGASNPKGGWNFMQLASRGIGPASNHKAAFRMRWSRASVSCVKWLVGPLHTRDWKPMTITLQTLSLVEKAKLVHVCFTLHSRDQHSLHGLLHCKVYIDSYMASNGSCFMVTWIIFKNHLLEVGLTQNWETMALWTLTTVDLFYFIMCEGSHE